jgi:hypothetical protein
MTSTLAIRFSGCPLPTTLYLFKKWIADISSKFGLTFNQVSPGKNTWWRFDEAPFWLINFWPT